MQTIRGTVSKVRVLKLSVSPLVRFSVNDTNCLIALHSLNFLYEVLDGHKVVVGGDYNKRGQFVVRKFCKVNERKPDESKRYASSVKRQSIYR